MLEAAVMSSFMSHYMVPAAIVAVALVLVLGLVNMMRAVQGRAGEDLVEKQNAEMGLMPVVANEAMAYGYEAEDRHFVRVFLGKEEPLLTFEDGLDVVRMLMTAYQSAEQGKTLEFPPRGLDKFVPKVAKGEWNPGR